MKKISKIEMIKLFDDFIGKYPQKPILIKNKTQDAVDVLKLAVEQVNEKKLPNEKRCGFGLYASDPFDGSDYMFVDDTRISRREHPELFDKFVQYGLRKKGDSNEMCTVFDDDSTLDIFCYTAGRDGKASERSIQYADWMTTICGNRSFIWITNEMQPIPAEIEAKFECYIFEDTVEDWLIWARETRKSGYQNVDELICQFIEKNPQFLFVPANHINPNIYETLSSQLQSLSSLVFYRQKELLAAVFHPVNDIRNMDIPALAAMLDKIDEESWYEWIGGGFSLAYPEYKKRHFDIDNKEDAKDGTNKIEEYCINLAKTNRLKFFANYFGNMIFDGNNVSDCECTKAWKTYIDECFTIK